jgi:hypothetical protein
MVQVTLVVRRAGDVAVNFWLNFEVPEVPRVGDYISIRRLDQREPFGEDVIVRHIWWKLFHPETHALSDEPSVGRLVDIFVECDPALSVHSSEAWRRSVESSGAQVEEFQVSRRPSLRGEDEP